MSHNEKIKTADLGSCLTHTPLNFSGSSSSFDCVGDQSPQGGLDQLLWRPLPVTAPPALRPAVPLDAYPVRLTLTQTRATGHGFFPERGPRM